MQNIEYFSAFLGGLVSVATPCVYPMIPITVAIFGQEPSCSQQDNLNKKTIIESKAFKNAVAYSLGIITTFTTLGLIASSTGTLFGSIQSHPIIIASFSVFLFFLLLSSLDIYTPSFLCRIKVPESKSKNSLLASFMVGAGTTLAASPCIGPALALILSYATNKADPTTSTILLMLYGLGFSLPFLLLTFFSPLVSKLPKSGTWLFASKIIISFFVASYLIYMVKLLFKFNLERIPFWFNSTLLYFSILTFLIYAWKNYTKGKKLKTLFLVLLSATIGTSFISSKNISANITDERITWIDSLEEGLKISKDTNKPLFVDFYADWCTSCVELDKLTFSQPSVINLINNKLIAVRIDMDKNINADKIGRERDINGLPTMIFIDKEGKEIDNKRTEGFLSADELSDKINSL